MKRASIVIRTYNEARHIGKLLEGINGQDFPRSDLEVILVDSGSTDGTVEITGKVVDKVVNIKPQDFTFGYSLNRGLEISEGEFSVFISAHCYPMSDSWLKNLLKPLGDVKVAGSYGQQGGVETSPFSELQIFKKWYPENSSNVQKNPFCNNANMAIRRSLWEKYPYDEKLTGLEDLDWAKRVLDENPSMYLSYMADAGIFHVHEETARGIFNRYKREGIAHRKIFANHAVGFFDFVKLFLANAISDYHFAHADRVLAKNFLEIPKFRFLQFYGTHVGMKYQGEVNRDVMERFYYPRKPFRKKKWS